MGPLLCWLEQIHAHVIFWKVVDGRKACLAHDDGTLAVGDRDTFNLDPDTLWCGFDVQLVSMVDRITRIGDGRIIGGHGLLSLSTHPNQEERNEAPQHIE